MITIIPVLMFYYALIQSGSTTPTILRDYAVAESIASNIDPQLVIGVINRESQFVPTRVNYNDMKQGCNSVGLVQIRDCNHPDVSFAQATDPVFAVNFLIHNIDKCTTWWKNTCPLSSP